MEYVELKALSVPALGFGTYGLRGDACSEAVFDALAVGYRHIDTAEVYENEMEVGAGLREAGVSRAEVFLTTKVWKDDLSPDAVRRSLDGSLRRLDTDYADLWLIHWPNPDYPLRDTLAAMERELAAGRVKHLGVSNFPGELFEEAAAMAPVVCNQVKFHPYERPEDVLAAVRVRDAFVTAYSPLAKGEIRGDPVLQEIGERHDKTAAQVALRWLIQQPRVVAIPKAEKASHRRDNIGIFDFSLGDDEMERIERLGGPS